MSKVLLISGSNRNGNTDYILNRIKNQMSDSELILLKNQNIEYCKGCLACHYQDRCIIKDDMNEIIDKLIASELIIFGIPNYFDNVTGLFKNFMDRLHPLYKSGQIKKKKVIFIFVGGGDEIGTKKELHQAIKGFVKYLGLESKKEYAFKALNRNDIEKQKEKIDSIVTEWNKYLERTMN